MDELYRKAVSEMASYDKVSTSFFQRRLSIKYEDAEKLVAELEKNGLLGKSKNGEPKDVILKLPKIYEVTFAKGMVFAIIFSLFFFLIASFIFSR